MIGICRSTTREFTSEQLRVIDALINAYAEVARELSRLMKTFQEAREAGERARFEVAKATHRAAHERCKALKLATELARAIFQRANEDEPKSRPLPPPGLED